MNLPQIIEEKKKSYQEVIFKLNIKKEHRSDESNPYISSAMEKHLEQFIFQSLVPAVLEGVREEIEDMSYIGVLESNEKRRGYDQARAEFLAVLSESLQAIQKK